MLLTEIKKLKMRKKAIFILLIFLTLGVSNLSVAQTDSTDLTLSMTDVTLLTETDTLLYGDGSYDQLNLDFAVSDTVTFSKVYVELTEVGTSTVIFKKVYALTDLESDALISDWNITIPFGNLLNTNSYAVAIIVERYDGALEATITKTLTP